MAATLIQQGMRALSDLSHTSCRAKIVDSFPVSLVTIYSVNKLNKFLVDEAQEQLSKLAKLAKIDHY
jgi:hypothetical protein